MRWLAIILGLKLCVIHISIGQVVENQLGNKVLKGLILNTDTKTPIEGAEIIITQGNLKFTCLSDSAGLFYNAQLLPGRVNLSIFHLNFNPVTLSQLEISSGKEQFINIELTPRIFHIKAVEIKSEDEKSKPVNEMSLAGARTFDVAETQRYAASFNDPARMAVSFAGVSTTGDASNEIIIRGNSSRGMLWRIEGIEVANPNHFSNGEGGTGGGISMLSSQIIGQSDFLTGAFAPEYGNALSGVFDIKFRKGNREKHEFALQFGILGMQACLEGPFSKKYRGSFLINYRYSTLTLLNAIGLPIVDNALVPQFQDLSFNISLPTKKLGDFSIFGIGGLSSAGELALKDSLKWIKPSDRYQDNNFQMLATVGISNTYFLKNKKTYVKSTLAAIQDQLKYGIDSLDNSYNLQSVFQESFTYSTFRLSSFINHQFNAKNIWKSGFIISQLLYKINSFGSKIDEDSPTLNNEGNGQQIQVYSQWKHRFSDQLELVSGIHYTWFGINRSHTIEPRISSKWQLNNTNAFFFGAGLHSRPEPVSFYYTKPNPTNSVDMYPNKNLQFAKSVHIIGGHDWNFSKNFKLRTEAYYQYLYDVPVDINPNTNISIINAGAGILNNTFINQGKGRNYGLEITIEKLFSNHYFLLFTGSVFNSQYSMGNSVWLNTRYNGNYMFNVLGGYEFKFGKKKRTFLNLNARLIWRGGNRYTPIDLNQSQLQNKEVLINQMIYSEKLKDYLRVDVSGFLKFNFKKWALIFSIEIQNITNQKNIARYNYDVFLKEIKTSYMFGIMPVFNFKFEF